MRGVFVTMPRGMPRTITTWTLILKKGSRTQNSTEGLKFGPRTNGTLLKDIQKPKSLKPQK